MWQSLAENSPTFWDIARNIMADRDRIAAVVLAAGLGTRMKSELPKVLHAVAGRPMLGHALASLAALSPTRTVVVTGPNMDAVAGVAASAEIVIQPERLGTADAVKAARAALDSFTGDVLIAYGDTPLVRPETYRAVVDARRANGAALAVLGFRPADPTGYGRFIVEPDGALAAIVEERDADEAQRAIGLCNSGIMAVDGGLLFDLLDRIRSDNAKGEYYLTDMVAVARQAGHSVAYIETADESETLGVNSRAELAVAEAVFQTRARAAAMSAGATLIDPTTVFFAHDTHLGRDVIVEPNVYFGPGVSIADGTIVRAFSHIEGAIIGRDVRIGPFARIRPETALGDGVHIGNFVELKNATLGDGAKANHLAYVGDSGVGDGANIGAGTITCNFDGVAKHRTEIGAGAFIGSNAALVAPVKIGDGAIVGAGSVITRNVEAGAVAVTRAPQKAIAGGAAALTEKNRARAGEPESET